MFGYFTGAAWKYVMEPAKHTVDFRTYEFVGYQPGSAVYYVRSDTPPGLKNAADILKAKGLVVGGLATEFLQGPPDPHHARPARGAAQIHHRLSAAA